MTVKGKDYSDLINRLRGVYITPVDDGAGTLDGKDTFTRQYTDLPKINEDAATAIEELLDVIETYSSLFRL